MSLILIFRNRHKATSCEKSCSDLPSHCFSFRGKLTLNIPVSDAKSVKTLSRLFRIKFGISAKVIPSEAGTKNSKSFEIRAP